ncbi:DUF6173 family protein [Methylobacterium oryzisoli]|uniref:DUF6173 family protein n=1 Tax=Methylobacterium oryzisoli TaxID=3385502 RepID=UPI00397DA884
MSNQFIKPEVPLGAMLPTSTTNPAKWMYERLVNSIIDFEKDLDPTVELGLRLVNFGSSETISIEDVGYWGPDLVIFYGKNNSGRPVELIQHITQVNVLLVAVPIIGPEPRRIGFILREKLEKED